MLRSIRISAFALRTAVFFALYSGAIIYALAQEKAEEAPAQPAAKTAAPLAQELHETIEKLPVTVTLPSGKRHTGEMVLTHFRPKGDGPFPIVIFNHGRKSDERAATPRYRHSAMVDFLVRRGFAVFEPTRLGYGDAGLNPDPESTLGTCTERQYSLILNALNAHTEATLKFAKTLPWVDGSRVILMGQSLGGYAAIGGTQLGAMGAINFAGGAGGSRNPLKKQPCGPSQVGAVIATAGKGSTAPTLWLYAENDRLWGADWPRKWHAGYVKAGGKAELAMFPPVDDDGHKLIGKGFRLWRPVVDQYLQKLGFAPPKSSNAPPPSNFARLEEIDKLPYGSESAKTGYQKFLETDVPRAFVVSTAGAWASRSGDNASDRALDWCRERSKGTCHLYAVDDAVVYKPPVSAEATGER